MKQHILLLMMFTYILTSCGNNKKTVEATSEDGKTTVTADVSKSDQVTEEMKKQTEELQKLPPLNLEELKALLPEQLMGAKRSNFQATSATGTGLATAEYALNDTTNVQVNIWDCGGPGGAGIYSSQYLGMFNFQSESDNEYTKTIEFQGNKAIEHCEKAGTRCTLTYFTSPRYMVVLEGNNIHPDGLKQAAGELKL
ncbi:MAG: hypothetical protein H7Y42_18645 [Chitinophagaceae bacterium]|nr:hypothetical protein [Chitinophagaceae bacterium]